ncbi:hypothetical protein [Acinetobacter radioresistens]|uniref:hypothetical protein n=2 Tax=Acinetobacter radioresistens TaxID=40216 RepID=UPI00028DF8C3|nr:hypothetical protein [Acinetobacter radioresistens]EKU3442102.1 hypothetical protein [Acinetobacter baumannii]BBL22288.1 hypothetical protein ACRAD_29590 [Acinetobacter radioresistens DSM 6976 = NBRC 102413 = CIP 103788]
MNILKTFKKNNAPQNLFLICMILAGIGSLIQLNWQAFIAWGCCFVLFVMFCFQRDHSNYLMDQLRELRRERLGFDKEDLE